MATFVAYNVTGPATQGVVSIAYKPASKPFAFYSAGASSAAQPITTVGPTPPANSVLAPDASVAIEFTPAGVAVVDRVIIWVRYPTQANAAELIYDGSAFVPLFAGSTRVGNAFALRRLGGWPAPPVFFAHASDTLGGVN